MRALVALLLGAAKLLAQPLIFPGGIVNAAGYQPAISPGGAIAQGSIFSVFGAGLGPPVPGLQASRFPLDTTLGGVTVRLLHQSGMTLAAIPVFVSDGQLNAILPSTTPVGLVSVSVSYNGRSSPPEQIKVVRSSFGVFSRNSSGTGPAIVQEFVTPLEQPLNSPVSTARTGRTMILWGTGLGPIAGPDTQAPTPGNLDEPVEVTLAGRPVPIQYQGRSGCCAGVDQINFRIPEDVPAGCAIPLQVRVQVGVYSNVTTLSLDPEGAPCSDAWNLPGAARRWGEISLLRTVLETGTVDTGSAAFGEGDAPVRFPPPGTCNAQPTGTAGRLDAGPQLTIAGPQGSRLMPRDPAGPYSTAAGSSFLGAGIHTVTGPGGADIGPITATVSAPVPPVWADVTGSRARGLTVTWTGGDSQNSFAAISGPGFLCAASVATGAFTIPPAVLDNAPALVTLRLAAVSRGVFSARGLDRAVLTYTHSTGRTLVLGDPLLASSPVVLPNGRRVLAELATTATEQQRGLMQRAELGDGRGMLFLFNRPELLSFWMYRTLIPLDIIWMDPARRIVFLSVNTPPCREASSDRCPLYGPREVSQYVLELAAGQAAQNGLQVGDRLTW